MSKQFHYPVNVTWTGNRGQGTTGYKEYDRSHRIAIEGKPTLDASSDAPFMGDVTKHNPEDMLVASLSACHMLWYLHLCADAGIVVTAYTDNATGTLTLPEGRSGHFTEVVLHPSVTITDASKIAQAEALHDAAHDKCFIANSCNFPVLHKPVITTQQ